MERRDGCEFVAFRVERSILNYMGCARVCTREDRGAGGMGRRGRFRFDTS